MAPWLNLLGLARRAGKLAPGENQVTQAMKDETVRLLVLAEDAGPSLYRKYHLWAQDLGVPLVRIGTKIELGHAMGMGPHAVLAILDTNFAEKILLEMRKTSGGNILDRKRQGQSQGLRTGQGTQTGQSSPHRPAPSAQGGKHQKSHEHSGAGSGQNGSRHHGGKASTRTQTGAQSSPTELRAARGSSPSDNTARSEDSGPARRGPSPAANSRSSGRSPAPNKRPR